MKYIASRRYRGTSLVGKDINIPATTEAEEMAKVIYVDGQPICFRTSQVAHEYFARNDDGNGMRRGKLTYAIAFSNRERYNENHTRRQRFTDDEIITLESKWNKYLIQGIEVILFNHDFFNADINDLEEMAKSINIIVKE